MKTAAQIARMETKSDQMWAELEELEPEFPNLLAELVHRAKGGTPVGLYTAAIAGMCMALVGHEVELRRAHRKHLKNDEPIEENTDATGDDDRPDDDGQPD